VTRAGGSLMQITEVVRKVTGWFYDMLQRLGPEADARRARALPLIAQDPTRVPDTLFSGPEAPLRADARARFFGQPLAASMVDGR